jgi:pimeloyl-ACP methyl ester carboxylesterase
VQPSTQTVLARFAWLIGGCILSGLVLVALTGLAQASVPVEQPVAPPLPIGTPTSVGDLTSSGAPTSVGDLTSSGVPTEVGDLTSSGVPTEVGAPNFPYPDGCDNGTQASGALYRICMPPGPWNKDLFIFAHGYMTPSATLRIPDEQLTLSDGTTTPDVVNLLGYAFATTSYSTNGLAVPEGIADITDLVAIFKKDHPTLRHVYLAGGSEGGLITAMAIEQHPDIFSGGLATCGPIGDFAEHVNYLGDFRVVFDYFFPGLIPDNAITIPQSLINTWDTYYPATVLPVLMDPASALSLTQLLSVTMDDARFVDSTTAITTVSGLLGYSVFTTNDGNTKLGGQPFDNSTCVYAGSLDDVALNAGVARFSAYPVALRKIQIDYQTSGQLRVPLITLHTTLDPIVPYWHEPLYRDKVVARGRMHRYDEFPPGDRYGHCNFTSAEVQSALALLVSRVENPPPVDVDLSDGASRIADPLSTVIFTHTLTNSGSQSGTFTLEAASAHHWPVAL